MDTIVTDELIKATVEKIENDFSKLLYNHEIKTVIHYLNEGMSPGCIQYACYLSWSNRYGNLDMRYAEHILSHWLEKGFTTEEKARAYCESIKQ
jgi:DnaD/phage-associated family protein